ncbi:MAG: extracellular solute-binding protein [Chloroflexi bacterium]|nr:extracellular solute-binding protein [Chloroflexota bacterium]
MTQSHPVGTSSERSARTRRTAFGAALTGPAVTVLAACGGPTGAADRPQTAKSYSVTFMTGDNLERSGLGEILDEFRRLNPNAQVEAVSGNDEKLRATMAAGTPPDVARINDNYVLDYAEQKLTQPMDPFMKTSGFRRQDFYELIYDFGVLGGNLGGKRYAWAMGAAGRLLYVNLELFRKSGVKPPPNEKWDVPGWTMDDSLEAARRLTQAPDTWGALIFHNTGYEQTWALNFGHPDGVFSKDGRRFTLADPVSVEAMQWVADLAVRHRAHPDRQTQVKEGAANLFQAGKIGMIFDGFGALGRYRQNLQFEWDVAPVPKKAQRRTVNSLITYGLPAGAKEPQGGWDLLAFTAGAFAGKVFARTGYVISPHRQHAQALVKAGADQPPKALHLFVEAMGYHTLPSVNARNVEELRRVYRPKLYDEVNAGTVSAREMFASVRPAVEALLQKQ